VEIDGVVNVNQEKADGFDEKVAGCEAPAVVADEVSGERMKCKRRRQDEPSERDE